jgi:hypothetical protein
VAALERVSCKEDLKHRRGPQNLFELSFLTQLAIAARPFNSFQPMQLQQCFNVETKLSFLGYMRVAARERPLHLLALRRFH